MDAENGLYVLFYATYLRDLSTHKFCYLLVGRGCLGTNTPWILRVVKFLGSQVILKVLTVWV